MKLSEMQKAIYQNKIDHQFNVTNIEKEFLALYGEIGEAFDAYRKQQEVGEILSIDLEAEIHKKMAVNQKRRYISYGNGYAKRIDD